MRLGVGSTGLFLFNRFLRLFPTSWAALLLTLGRHRNSLGFAGSRARRAEVLARARNSVSSHNLPLFAVANAFIFGQSEMTILAMDPSNGALAWTTNFDATDPNVWRFLFIPQAWSIQLELLFYARAPFLVRRSARFVVAVTAASFALRAFCYPAFHLPHRRR